MANQSPPELVQQLREAGEVGASQCDWLLERFELLKPDGPSQADPVRSALDDAAPGEHGHDNDLSLERDALWFHLYLAVARLLKEPSTSEDRNWAAPRLATLLDILAFISSGVPDSWPDHLRRQSSRKTAVRMSSRRFSSDRLARAVRQSEVLPTKVVAPVHLSARSATRRGLGIMGRVDHNVL